MIFNQNYLDAKLRLLGEKSTESTHEPWPESVAIGSKLDIWYNLMCLSSDPVIKYWESCEKANDRTGMACPSSVRVSLKVTVSKILIIPSTDAQAIIVPSGL